MAKRMQKQKTSKSTKIGIIAIFIVVAVFIAFGTYKYSKSNLFDKALFTSFSESIEEKATTFKSNDDLKNYITAWADTNKLAYSVDASSNIIFHYDSIEDKKSVAPTVVCVNYNYKNCAANSKVLATAACCAASGIKSGEYTIIFFNNADNIGTGYKGVDNKYFTDNANVIYLDYGNKTSISRNSYGMQTNRLIIPATTSVSSYDSAVTISITGLSTDDVNDYIAGRPNLANILSNVLQKLNTKSIGYQLASVEMASNGNMYPTELKTTILYNSYSESTITDYLDDKIEDFEKEYHDDYPDASFTYSIVSSENDVPKVAFDEATTKALNTALFTIKNGAYRYDKDNAPEGYSEGDIYGINCITGISYNGTGIVINIDTCGQNDAITNKIVKENASVAELSGATHVAETAISPFKNSKDLLFNEIQSTFIKANDLTGPEMLIRKDDDRYFNSCSLLQAINPAMDIVHLRASDDSFKSVANTVLCFIQVQGNFLKL